MGASRPPHSSADTPRGGPVQSTPAPPTNFIVSCQMPWSAQRAGAPILSFSLLSFGPPAAGAQPVPMKQSRAKRPRPTAEAEQACATPVAPHGLWPRPHHPQQLCWPPPWRAAGCRPHQTHTRPKARPTHRACLMAEASLTLVTVAPPRRRGPRPGGPYGHKPHTTTDPTNFIVS